MSLSYPSKIMGVPNAKIHSREIEVKFDQLSKEARRALESALRAEQTQAAALVTPLHQKSAALVQKITELHRDSVLDARKNYEADVRTAQSRRDQAEAAAKKQREENLNQATREFFEATAPVEQALKQATFKLQQDAEDARAALAAEFQTYRGAAQEREVADAEATSAARLDAEAAAA